jgi:hypothetical protein
MPPDLEQLARFARVEPPADLDAWVRARLRAAVIEHAPAAPSGAGLPSSGLPSSGLPSSARREPSHGVSPEPSRALSARRAPARTAASVPLVERLALAVGAVACGIQASGLVVRVLWSVLTLGR